MNIQTRFKATSAKRERYKNFLTWVWYEIRIILYNSYMSLIRQNKKSEIDFWSPTKREVFLTAKGPLIRSIFGLSALTGQTDRILHLAYEVHIEFLIGRPVQGQEGGGALGTHIGPFRFEPAEGNRLQIARLAHSQVV